jgi:hypothetical protein
MEHELEEAVIGNRTRTKETIKRIIVFIFTPP